MRFLVWLVCCTASAQGQMMMLASGSSYNGYVHYRDISINPNSTLVPATQTNFPVLIAGTYAYLKTVGNGGNIQNTTTLNSQTVPADLIFTSDNGCVTALNWEVASYTATTGDIEVWVKVASLGTGVTHVYMCYNNAAITTYQGGASTTVWPATATGIYHLSNSGGSTLTATNSSTPLSNGTITAATSTAGPFTGGAANFVAANSAKIDFGTPNLVSYTQITASVWMKASSVVGTIWTLWSDTGTAQDFIVDDNGGTGKLRAFVTTNSVSQSVIGSTNLADGNWHYLALTWSTGSATLTGYVDGGNAVTHAAAGANLLNATGLPAHMELGNYTNNSFYTGSAAEAHVWNTLLSANWIQTEYNNQSNTAAFYSIGAEN